MNQIPPPTPALTNRPIYKAIAKQYQKMTERKWDKMYWAIDLHETILEPTYKADNAMDCSVYEGAMQMLMQIISCEENHIILWSSLPDSGPTGMVAHKKALFPMEYWVKVQLNENAWEKGTEYAVFDKKFYFNVLLDDKAGFDPGIDFYAVRLAIEHHRPQYLKAMGKLPA